MRRVLLVLLVAAFAGPLVIARQAVTRPGRFIAYGSGTSSCGRWIASYKNGDDHHFNLNWVLGFVSGYGYTNVKSMRLTDSDAIEAWIDKYCREHPLETMNRAELSVP